MATFTPSHDPALDLYYETRGEHAHTLVLLNGMSQTTANWRSQARVLSATHRVLMYDCRGQGRSNMGNSPITMEAHISDLRALLQDQVHGPLTLIGFSHGARVALEYAKRFSEELDSLVLTSTGGRSNALRRTIVRSWQAILELGGLEAMAWTAIPDILGRRFLLAHEKHIEGMVKATVQRNSEAGLKGLVSALAQYPPGAEGAEAIRCPVLLMSAGEDLLVTHEDAAALANRLPNCVHRHIEECGHTIPIEEPEWWRTQVLDFLQA